MHATCADLFYWYFTVEGAIEFEVKLSGELSTNVLSQGESVPEYGVLVAPGVNAQVHQHMFCVRLDTCIDGDLNNVDELEIKACAKGDKNKHGNAFQAVKTRLSSELNARRDNAPSRTWRISSADNVNKITGEATAYRLIPYSRGSSQPGLLTHEDSAVSSRGQFARHALWVTKFNAEERFAAGDFPTQAIGSDGLPIWTRRDAKIENEDLVVWHSFGVAHIPRVEDFPVMPCESVGFSLKPDGFFCGNPAIDLPPVKDDRSTCCGNGAVSNNPVAVTDN